MASIYTPRPQKNINCPQCGYKLPIYFEYTKLIECPSCKSTIFLGDEVAKKIGEASALSPEPSLIQMHKPFKYQNHRYIPVGKIRYSYDRGFWEEWYLKRDDGKGWWLSIDEGDFALEQSDDISSLRDFNAFAIDSLRVGKFVGDYLVSEMGYGKCEGFSGELPEPIEIGLTHKYIHLSGDKAELLTIEYDRNREGDVTLFRGRWIDPFLIKRL